MSAGAGSGKLRVQATLSGGSGALSKWQYTTDGGTTWSDLSETGATLNHVVTGLTDGTNYTFQVRAVNATGAGPASAASAATAPAAESLAASGVTHATALLTLGKHSGDWYTKYTSPSGGSCSSVVSSGTTTANLTGLSGNTSYTFKAYGDSGCGTELASATLLTTPSQVSGVTVTEGNGSLSVSWTAVTGTVTGYTVSWRSGGDSRQKTVSSGTSTTISGLINEATYTVVVSASNGSGAGPVSAAVTGIPSALCDRTPAVRAAIVAAVSGKASCGITATELASISGTLNLKNQGISSLKVGDFAGLSSVTKLDLSGNSLSSLPAGIFNPLTGLRILALGRNSLTTLPAGSFDQLSGLTDLSLYNNSLSSLPSGIFDKLLNLTALDLGENNLSSLSAGIFEQMRAFTGTLYLDGNSYTSLPSDIFEPLTGMTGLQLSNTLSCLPWVPASVGGRVFSDRATRAADFSACDAGVTASVSSLSVGVPSSRSYTLVLSAPPNRYADSGTVTVTISSSAPGKATVAPASLTFTPSNWSTPQTVTVSGLAVGAASISHVVSGGGYGSVSVKSVAVEVSSAHLSASTVSASTATLTLGNHASSWYYQYTTPSGGACSSQVGSTTSTASLTGLSTATRYTFKAYRDNTCSTTALASETFLTKPGQVSGVTVRGGSNRSLEVSWTAASGTVTGYKVQWKSGSQDYNTTRQQTVSSGTSTTVTGLVSGTAYTVRVIASNATGDGAASSGIAGRLPVTSLTASDVGNRTATLTISNYMEAWYYQSTAYVGGSCSVVVSSGTTSVSVSNLSGNTSYLFKAYSDSGCTAELAAAAAFLTKPSQPSKPVARAGGGSGTLRLTATLSGGSAPLSKWQVTRDDGTTWQDVSDNDNSLNHLVTGLSDGASYTFKVRAVNATGAGPASPASDVATPSAVVVSLAAGSVTHATARLTLTNHGGAWYYKYTVPTGGSCSAAVGSGTTTVNLTGLSSGASYTYKAYSDSGCTVELAPAAAFLTRPAQVSGVTVTRGDGSLNVGWGAVSGTVSGYKVQWKSGSEGYNSGNRQRTTSATSATITGLGGGTVYTVRVTAYNTTGDGPTSTETTAAPQLPLCDRTPAVRDAIVAAVPGKTTCSSITTADLAAITGTLDLSNKGISSLKIGDFDGLSGVTTLNVSGNGLSSLPMGIFDPLTGLENLAISSNNLSSVPSGIFDKLTKLDYLSLWNNDLTSLPSGIFDKLTNMTDMDLGTNKLTSLPAGIFDNFTNFTGILYLDDNQYTTLPFNIFKNLKNMGTLNLSKTLTCLPWFSDSVFLTSSLTSPSTLPACDAGVSVSKSSLSVNDSLSKTYTLVLSAPPNRYATSGNVTITVSSSATGSATVSPATLTFTPSNWSTPQTVTVSGVAEGSASISHSISGGGYGSVSVASVAVNVTTGDLSVSEVGASTARLSLSRHTGGWYYKYTVPTGGSCSAAVSSGTTTVNLTGLSSGTSYTYKAYGDSSCTSSNEIGGDSFLTKPEQVSGVTVSGGNGSLSVSWTALSGTVTGYKVQWKSGEQSYDATRQQVISSGSSTTINGLVGGTSYSVRVIGSNGSGDGAASAEGTGSPTGRSLTVSEVEKDGATLWLSEHAGDWYSKYSSPSGGSCSAVVGAGRGTSRVTGLSSGVSYVFKAYSDRGCTLELATASSFLTKPSQVSGVTATTVGNRSLSVGWSGVSGTVSGYKVQWRASTESYNTLSRQRVVSSGSSTTITGLTGGAVYSVRVTATNATGDGPSSAEATATPWLPLCDRTPAVQSAIISVVPGKTTCGSITNADLAAITGTLPVESYQLSSLKAGDFDGLSGVTELKINNNQLSSLPVDIFHPLTSLTKLEIFHNNLSTLPAGIFDKLTKVTFLSLNLNPYKTLPSNIFAKMTSLQYLFLNNKLTCLPLIPSSVTSGGFLLEGKPASGLPVCDAGVSVSESSLSVNDGVGTTYTLVLSAPPNRYDSSGNVTITPTISPTGKATVSPSTLTFSPSNWSTPQTVTVTGVAAGTASISHGISGGGYGSVSVGGVAVDVTAGGTLSVSEVGASTARLTLSRHTGAWYYKYSAPTGGSCSAEVSSGTSSVVLTGLSTATSYTYKAYSDSSCSTSNALGAASVLTKPGQVSGVTVRGGNGSLSVSWSGVSGTVSGYKVQWRSGSQGYSSSRQQVVSSGTTTTVTGLSGRTTYTVRVMASNASGDGAASIATAPRDASLTASAVASSSAVLTIGGHTGDWYYQYSSPAGGSCSAVVSSGTTTASLTGLVGNTSYTFKAYSDSGCAAEVTSASGAAEFLTTPSQVGGVVVTAGNQSLVVGWDGVSGTVSGYKVQWKSGEQSYDATRQQVVSGATRTLLNLSNGTVYKVRVMASNATGDGPASAEVSGAPRAATLSASGVEQDRGVLSLGIYTGDWYYQYSSPAGGSCSAVVGTGTTTAQLTGLVSNTSYTFKGYSDSSCTVELGASAVVLTKPAAPSQLVVSSGVGSGQLRLSATLPGGGATLSKWQFASNDSTTWNDVADTDSSLNHLVTGLTNGASYTFKVRAVNASGAGPATTASAAGVPAAPTLAASSVTHHTAQLAVTNYSVNWYYQYTTPVGGSCSAVVGSGTTTASLTGLVGKTSYTFKAYGDSGCTTALAPATTFLTPPAQPSQPVTSAGLGSGKLRLASTVGGGSAPLSKWQYTTDDGGSWQDVSETDNSLSTVVSGLSDGTSYSFKVRAVNGAGAGPASPASESRVASAVTLSTSAVTRNGATLRLGNHSGAWYYKYTVPSGGACSAVVASGVSTASLTGLAAATRYVFKAYGDSGCTTELAVAPALLTTPGQVRGLTVTMESSGALSVGWTALPGTVAGYRVQWKSGSESYNSGSRQQTVSSGSGTTINGLTSGTTYTVRVTAYNATGAGPVSVEVGSTSYALCDRTAAVRDAIVAAVPGKTTCASITTADLAAITGTLGLGSKGITTLKAGDFVGLSNVTRLDLQSNSLTTLPAGVFDPLTGLTRLRLDSNNLTSLPAGSFDKLSKLTALYLTYNSLTSLPAGIFDELTSLTNLDLSSNDLASLPAGIFDELTAFSGALLMDLNDYTTLPANLFQKLTSMRKLWLSSTLMCLPLIPESVTGSLKVTAASLPACDAAVTLSRSSLSLGDSSSKSYTVVLAAPPNRYAGSGDSKGTVTVTLSSSATGKATVSPATLSFSSGNWSTPQTVTVSGVATGAATVSHTVSGGGYGSVSVGDVAVTVTTDNLSVSNVTASTATLTISEHTGPWYYKYTTPTGGGCTAVGQPFTTARLTGLSGGTSYTFNAYSDGACSTEVARETFLTRPEQVGGVTLTPGNGSLVVNWSAPTGTVSGYKVQWKSGSDDYNTTSRQETVSGATSTTTTLTGLANSTSYSVRVTAVNGSGDGTPSPAVTGSPAAASLSATAVETTTATLSISGHRGSWYYTTAAPALGDCSAVVSGGVTTAGLTGLASNTRYTVRAYSDSTCTTELTNATTTARFLTKPGTPSQPVASAGSGSGTLRLWASLSGGDAALSKWQVSRDDGASWSDESSTATTLNTVVTGLSDGTAYSFKVRAVNSTGVGAASAASAASTPSAVTLSASAVTRDGATLTLGNHGSAWYYNYTTPGGGSCSAVVAAGTTTVNLASLTPATRYTYQAYSDNSCSTALAAVAVLTRPDQVGGVVVTPGNGSLHLRWRAVAGTVSGYKVQWKSGSDNYNTTSRQETVSGATTTLTGLANSTSYTLRVTAYNSSGDALPSPETTGRPAKEPLRASAVAATTAVLTVNNHTSDWYYQYTTPSGGSCSAVVSSGTTTAGLTGLVGNTRYTFKAYSDSSCTTVLAGQATARFLTKPGTPSRPVTSAGAGSGKLRLSSSLSGGNAPLTKWQLSQDEGVTWRDVSSTAHHPQHRGDRLAQRCEHHLQGAGGEQQRRRPRLRHQRCRHTVRRHPVGRQPDPSERYPHPRRPHRQLVLPTHRPRGGRLLRNGAQWHHHHQPHRPERCHQLYLQGL